MCLLSVISENMNSVNAGDNFYDFTNEENSPKWKGVLTAALKRVSPTLSNSCGFFSVVTVF